MMTVERLAFLNKIISQVNLCNMKYGGNFRHFAMDSKDYRIAVNDEVFIHMTDTFAWTTVYANGMWIVSASFTENVKDLLNSFLQSRWGCFEFCVIMKLAHFSFWPCSPSEEYYSVHTDKINSPREDGGCCFAICSAGFYAVFSSKTVGEYIFRPKRNRYIRNALAR